MKVTELLNEGFSGFSVGASDTAADLYDTVGTALKTAKKRIEKETGGMAPPAAVDTELCEIAIKELRKGLKDEGNSYNTHGTLNVAMVMCEKYPQFRKLKPWKTFAKQVSDKLVAELKKKHGRSYSVDTKLSSSDGIFGAEYDNECAGFSKKLAKMAE